MSNTDSGIKICFFLFAKVVEIQINIPYGHVAGKWWGRRDVRPILCIHGWQDNAASFDALIPLLPDHVGYLAIDMPGHGHSSRIPNGLLYSNNDDIYIVNFIIHQFGWSKVSLMAHSLGAISCFIFAASFPEKVDLLITLDALQPRILTPSNINYLSACLDEMHLIDKWTIAGAEPPTYTYEELIEKMNSQTFLSVKRSSANYLLARAVKESGKEAGRYYFTRDPRLKLHQIPVYTPEINESFAKSIECPILFVKALQSGIYAPKEEQVSILEVLMEKPNFEMTAVEGGHHVHLNEPFMVSGAISEFLLKHISNRCSASVVGSKL